MPRIPELTLDTAAPPVKAAMQAQLDEFGFVLNPIKVMGYCPAITKAHAAFGRAIDEEGNIEGRLRYLLYTRVASQNGCPF